MKNRKFILTSLMGLLASAVLLGQSHRYWSNTYSEEAFLLSGAVVAGSSSTGAIYYNPGAISQATNARLSLNSNILSVESIRLDNLLGETVDASVTDFEVLPSFFSLLFKDKKNPRLVYEIAWFSREAASMEINEGLNGLREVFPALPGEENFDARLEFKQEYSDYWAGFGAGYLLNERLSVGLSSFFISRSGSYKYFNDISVYPTSDSVEVGVPPTPFFQAGFLERASFKFSQLRMIWKAGLLYTNERIQLGLNLTTPSYALPLLENSNASKKISRTNAIDPQGEALQDFVIVDQQEEQPIQFKDPFALALGIQLKSPDQRTSYYFTAEYFAGIATYATFEAALNPDITTEELFEQLPNPYFLRSYSAANPILNIAIGYRRQLTEPTSLLLGFRTDFNYLNDYDFSDVQPLVPQRQVNMNVFHFTGGTTFNIRSNLIILGLQYSFGSKDNLPRLGSIGNLDPDSPEEIQLPEDMNARLHTLSLFIGFNFSLIRNPEESGNGSR